MEVEEKYPKVNSNPISNREITLERSPSIPIAPRYLVSKEEIPIKEKGKVLQLPKG